MEFYNETCDKNMSLPRAYAFTFSVIFIFMHFNTHNLMAPIMRHSIKYIENCILWQLTCALLNDELCLRSKFEAEIGQRDPHRVIVDWYHLSDNLSHPCP